MRSGWLLRDGDVVCALEMADSPAERRRACAGARAARARCTSTAPAPCTPLGMKFPIDVAFLSADLTVVRVARLKPWRVAVGGPDGPQRRRRPRPGSLERWGVRVGDQLEVREVAANGAASGAAVSDGAAGPARAGGHADREPG